MRNLFLCLLVLLTTPACISISSQQQQILRGLERCGIRADEQGIKNPALAGLLNILPGFGNFYLASGNGDNGQGIAGVMNLLLWPSSVVWGIPQAAIDADTLNKLNTLEYYQFNKDAKLTLQDRCFEGGQESPFSQSLSEPEERVYPFRGPRKQQSIGD